MIPTGILEKFEEFFPVHHVTKPKVNKIKPSKEDDDDYATKLVKSFKWKASEEISSTLKIERKAFQLDYISENLRPLLIMP